jgi:diguanylate cyclase (GGDEF)-like protein/PAS domain S-box-containing protein
MLPNETERILEMVATGAPLSESLCALIEFLESRAPGVRGSILLLDQEGVQVYHGASSPLPSPLITAMDGQPSRSQAGSCDTEILPREPVFVENIAVDPSWEGHRNIALKNGVHAHWSTPIIDAKKRVLGTLTLYNAKPELPTHEHLRLMDTVTHIASIAISREHEEEALRESEAAFRRLFESSRDAIMTLNIDKGFLSGNPAAIALFRCADEAEFISLSPADVSPEFQPDGRRSYEKAREMMELALDKGAHFFEWMHKRTDGTEFFADVLLTRMNPGLNGLIQATVRDISERKSAEVKLQRLTQLYAALSQCNQAIVRCTCESELFPQVCRDIVNFGGLKMAWIGILDDATKRIVPVASFGAGQDYLETLYISVVADKPAGRGPVGTALRENRAVWCQDFKRDPMTVPWQETATQYGLAASAAIPLHCNGQPIGTFALYAGTAHAFDESIQTLLLEMALDIDYALTSFDRETRRQRAEEDLRESEQRLRTIIETEPECIKVIGLQGELMDINATGLKLLEVSSLEEARQNSLLDFIPPEFHENLETLRRQVMQGQNAIAEFEIVGLKGTRRQVETHAAPLRDAKGNITALLGITRDITERRRNEARIQYLANYDVLTGLPNRAQLDEHLRYALSLAKRSNGHLALMFLDLDRFKEINDSLGHGTGDALLVMVAKRLQSLLREEDTISRLGGDEFIAMLPGSDAQGAAQVAQKILDIVATPYQIERYELSVTVSIGIAVYPGDGINLETLSQSADTAMYRAKNEGRNGYRFFTPEMQARTTRNMQLVNALRHALEYDQFDLYYQPQISLVNNRIVGAEALLRWNHPELGQISPAEFIPVAEDTGLIIPIGEWVIRKAIQQLKQWLDHGALPVIMAVNLSAVQFLFSSLSDLISRLLQEASVPSHLFELELTEGVAMHDPQSAIAIMTSLSEQGIRLSIDDFGTGYSSLNYLKKFNVYKLKIDQSFVQNISTAEEDRAIISAIISMAKSLGLKTIAEGVETHEQLVFLQNQGCDEGQGYYFSQPLPANQFDTWLSHR